MIQTMNPTDRQGGTPAIKEIVNTPSKDNGEPDEEAQRVNSQGEFIEDEEQMNSD